MWSEPRCVCNTDLKGFTDERCEIGGIEENKWWLPGFGLSSEKDAISCDGLEYSEAEWARQEQKLSSSRDKSRCPFDIQVWMLRKQLDIWV